ncbi:MAG: hypothetical protein JSS66_13280 [Armatimonadetes bacterium]|nr:hypothetical protein [Armatimonadota bacterium]
MKRSGFTLMETIASIAILITLGALLAPALAELKLRAKVTSSFQRLRQFHIALSMYRSEYDGDGCYGPPAAMGLPTLTNIAYTRLGFTWDFWKSPCGRHPKLIKGDSEWYAYCPGDGYPWSEDIVLYRENTPLMMDTNCSPPGSDPQNPYDEKYVLGVLLSGQLKARRGTGRYEWAEWWGLPAW